MIQTVTTIQELFAKAMLVDLDRLASARSKGDVVEAEECLKDAYATDVRSALVEWRERRGLPGDPLRAHRESGYLERVSKDRAGRKSASSGSYA